MLMHVRFAAVGAIMNRAWYIADRMMAFLFGIAAKKGFVRGFNKPT